MYALLAQYGLRYESLEMKQQVLKELKVSIADDKAYYKALKAAELAKKELEKDTKRLDQIAKLEAKLAKLRGV